MHIFAPLPTLFTALLCALTALALPGLNDPPANLNSRQIASRNLDSASAARGISGNTNAQRLARGLSPLYPKRLYSSRTTYAPRTVPSGTTDPVLRIYIAGYNAITGALVGYFKDMQTVASSTSQATVYSYDSSATGPTYLYNAATGMYTSLRSYDNLKTTGYVTPDFEPVATRTTKATLSPGSTYLYDQTDSFTIDSTGKISMTYFNKDGSSVPLTGFKAGGYFYAAVNLADFRSANSVQADEMIFKIVLA